MCLLACVCVCAHAPAGVCPWPHACASAWIPCRPLALFQYVPIALPGLRYFYIY